MCTQPFNRLEIKYLVCFCDLQSSYYTTTYKFYNLKKTSLTEFS